MDLIKDVMEGKRSENDRDDFWAICAENGVVSLCSQAAALYGTVSGVTKGCELVRSDDRADFEDALRRVSSGGDLSVVLRADPHTGYKTVHLKGVRIFSSFALELRLYKNKEEYLAASCMTSERIGRVFDYVNSFACGANSSISEFPKSEAEVLAANNTLIRALNITKRLYSEGYVDPIRNGGRKETSICDTAAVFDMIADFCSRGEEFRFDILFENNTSSEYAMCNADASEFVGVTLMAAAVSARLSRNNSCRLTLSNNGDAAMLEAECLLNKDCALYGRSDKFDSIYRYIPANPVELMMYEQMAAVHGWSTEYSADGDGRAVIRTVMARISDADRLKYRDSTSGVPAALREYSDFLRESFLPDAQEQREY